MTRSIQNLSSETILLTSVVGALSLTALGAYLYQRKKRYGVPTKWEAVGKVKNLYIYPLKSGRRTETNTAVCTEYGLQAPKSGTAFQLRDRNLVVYKEKNNEHHRHPKMLLIETIAQDQDHFTLNAPGMPTLKVKIPTIDENKIASEIEFWTREKIFTVDCGEEAAKWISRYILETDSGLRLGFHDGLHRRNIMGAYKKYLPVYPKLRNEATGMYSNLSSYLLVNQASVDDLRSRMLDSDVTANNFRPNILVEGASPFAEDDWQWVKIGDVILYLARFCTRCDFTTVTETAVKSQDNEPLRTLRKYRVLKDLMKIELDGYRTVMGNNMGLLRGGQISVGDVVYVGKS